MGATWTKNGHVVDYQSHRFVCLNCGARYMSMMQFNAVECRPKKPTQESEPQSSVTVTSEHGLTKLENPDNVYIEEGGVLVVEVENHKTFWSPNEWNKAEWTK